MKIEWTHYASVQRKQVSDYIRKEFGVRRSRQFKQDVERVQKQLKLHPNIGQIDPLFESRVDTYRSVIINGLNKMVYRIEGDTINIVAFWDTRSEPEGQAEQVR